jgi:hypothetical protein
MYVAIIRHRVQTSTDAWNVLSFTKICTSDTSLGEIMEWAEKYKEENFNVEISEASPTPRIPPELKKCDSDLSNVKAGDWIYTIFHRWERVVNVAAHGVTPYRVKTEYDSFTIDGKQHKSHPHASAWVRPPACLNAPPKPTTKFKKGDRVLVRDSENDKWTRKYFSHYLSSSSMPYYCFKMGNDEWASDGETTGWKYCKKWEEK